MSSPLIAAARPVVVSPPPLNLEGQRVRLCTPTNQFIEYTMIQALEGQIPWFWRGPESPRFFEESFWHDVLSQFAVHDKRTGAPVGYVRADQANMFHGYAYLTFVLFPDYRLKGWPLEAGFLFGTYLFQKYVFLQNVYAEVTGNALRQYRSAEGTLFEIEGCLRERCVVNGIREDLYILTFNRDRFLEHTSRV